MLTIGPVGSAAWVRVRPSIREAGEAGTRRCLRHLTNRVAEPTGFLYARIGLSAGPATRINVPILGMFFGAGRHLSARAEGNRMATATLKRRVKNPSVAKQRAERLKATAAAMSADVEADRSERLAAKARVEFVSRLDARDMSRDDIGNVRPLKVDEARDFDLFAVDIIAAEREVWDWPADDERWTLTPHELRKQREREAKEE